MSVQVTIVSSEPCAVYQDTVYDREVIIEFADGTRIGAFDPLATVSETFVGKTIDVECSLLVNNVSEIEEQSIQIEPNSEEPLGWSSHDFYGRVVNQEGDSEVNLDTGVGIVETSLDFEEWQELSDDSFLHVQASRVDVTVKTE
jgi:hypothetical protein